MDAMEIYLLLPWPDTLPYTNEPQIYTEESQRWMLNTDLESPCMNSSLCLPLRVIIGMHIISPPISSAQVQGLSPKLGITSMCHPHLHPSHTLPSHTSPSPHPSLPPITHTSHPFVLTPTTYFNFLSLLSFYFLPLQRFSNHYSTT